jgi:hypothetical protein
MKRASHSQIAPRGSRVRIEDVEGAGCSEVSKPNMGAENADDRAKRIQGRKVSLRLLYGKSQMV